MREPVEGPPGAAGAPNAAEPSIAEQRAVGLVSSLRRLSLRLAMFALVAGTLVWLALLRLLAGSDDTALTLAVSGVAILLPAAVLVLFAIALAALRELPERIREAPAAVRQRATEIRRRAGEARERRGLFGAIRSVVGLWRSVAAVRELADGLGAAALLVTPWMLVATGFAAAAALLEIVLVPIALVVLAVA